MVSPVTESMIEGRLKTIVAKSGIPLKLDHNSVGWTLYKVHDVKSGGLSGPIAFADSKSQIFQILKAMDWIISEISHKGDLE